MDQSLLDQALAEAYACARQDLIILHTLEINHKAFTEPARVVRWPVTDNEPRRFSCLLEPDAPYNPGQLVDFLGLPFEIVLPEVTTESPGTFQIRMDNVGDSLDEYLEAACMEGGEISAIYREFIKGTEGTDGPRSVWGGIQINSPELQGQTLTFSGAVLGWMSRAFGYLYTSIAYPQLVRSR